MDFQKAKHFVYDLIHSEDHIITPDLTEALNTALTCMTITENVVASLDEEAKIALL